MITVSNVSLSFGGQLLFKDVDLKFTNGTMLPADVETEPKTLQTTRRKASPAARNAVIPKPLLLRHWKKCSGSTNLNSGK